MTKPKYNLVMTAPGSPATELREAMTALAHQLRRHRLDSGLTLSQMEVLGEVNRSGIIRPAELAARMHVRAQSLTDSLNELENRKLISRRQDDQDRRRQLIEVTEDGSALLSADRQQRDSWLTTIMANTLSDMELQLLLLVAPILQKLADAEAGRQSTWRGAGDADAPQIAPQRPR